MAITGNGRMTPEQRQEEISKAYLHAVAAKGGFAVGSWSQDHGCLDASVGAAATVGSGHLVRPKVDIQLKATRRQDVERETFISWQLEIDHYDQLRAPSHCPHLLVVLLLPEDVDQSIEHSAEQLVLRRCAYWVTMTGMEPVRDQRSKTVQLPKTQLFSPAALRDILEAVSQGRVP
ncbi:MAG: DUF4365 domain-containing protein [Sandaracinaceae bacterium]